MAAAASAVAGALGDRFQQQALAGAIVLVTASIVLAVRFPTGRADAAPLASIGIGTCLVVVGLIGVLHALRAGTAALALPVVVRDLTTTALQTLDVDIPDDAAPADRGPARARIRSTELGWVRWIDRDRLAGLLPPGARAELRVDVGSLVAVGDVMIEVDHDGIAQAEVARTVEIQPIRCPHADIGFALQRLGDVALHALQPSSADASTAKEAVQYLGIVLERLVEVGLPSGHRVRGDRAVVAAARWSVEEHLGHLLDPILVAATDDPIASRQLDDTLASVQARADEIGDRESFEVLGDQRDRLQAGPGWSNGASAGGPVASRRPRPNSPAVEIRD